MKQDRGIFGGGAFCGGLFSGSVPAVTDLIPPSVSSLTAGAQSGVLVPITATALDEAAASTRYVVTAASQPGITAQQVYDGTDAADVAAAASGVLALTQGAPTANAALPTEYIGDVYVNVVLIDGAGNRAAVIEVGPVSVDTVTPSFAAPAAFGATDYLTGALASWTAATGPAGTTITLEAFTLGGADRSGEISGTSWDTSGEARDEIALQYRVTHDVNGLFALSTPVTANLFELPDVMDAPTVTSTGETSISVALAADPDDGGKPITSRDIRYSTDEATWTEILDVTSPRSITSLASGTLFYAQGRVNNIGGPGGWSLSDSATTDAAAGPLTAPRVLFDAVVDSSDSKTAWETPSTFRPAGTGPAYFWVAAMPGTFQSEETILHATLGAQGRNQGDGVGYDNVVSEFSGLRLTGWLFTFEAPPTSDVTFQVAMAGGSGPARALIIQGVETPGSITAQLGSINAITATATPQNISTVTTYDDAWVLYFAASASADGNSIIWTNADAQFDLAYTGGNSPSADLMARIAYEHVVTAGSADADVAIGTLTGDYVVMALEVRPQITVPGQMTRPTLTVTGSTSIQATLAADPADNGFAISSRTLEHSSDGTTWTQITGLTAGETVDVTGLAVDTTFYMRSFATNSQGDGAPSSSATARTQAAASVPDAASVAVGAQDASGDLAVTITDLTEDAVDSPWAIYAADQGALTGAQVKTAAGAAASDAFSLTAGSLTAQGALPTGLDLDNCYFYQAFGTSGGPYSAAHKVAVTRIDTILPGAMVADTHFTVADEATDGDALVTLLSNPTTGDFALGDFEVRAGAGGAWSNIGDLATATVVSGFTNGAATDVYLRGTNAIGPGADGTPDSVTTTAGGGGGLAGYDTATVAINDTDPASVFTGSITAAVGDLLYVDVGAMNNGGTLNPDLWTVSLDTDGALALAVGTLGTTNVGQVEVGGFWIKILTAGTQTLTVTLNGGATARSFHAAYRNITGASATPIVATDASADRSNSNQRIRPTAHTLASANNVVLSSIVVKAPQGGTLTVAQDFTQVAAATGQTPGGNNFNDHSFSTAYHTGTVGPVACQFDWTAVSQANSVIVAEIEAA